MKHYYKNCTVKYTDCERIKIEDVVTYRFHSKEFKDCLVCVTEGKKGIVFYYGYGVQFFEIKKRVKSLKFTGVKIKAFEFEALKLRMQCEAIDNEKDLQKQIDLNDFPFVK